MGDHSGEVDAEFSGYFQLEPIEQIDEFHKQVEIEKYAPGFLAFGSDGSGERLVFDGDGRVYLLPLIGMGSDTAIKTAESSTNYLTRKR